MSDSVFPEWARVVGGVGLRVGEGARPRFTFALFVASNYAHHALVPTPWQPLTAVLLLTVSAWFLGCSFAVWQWRRIEDRNRRKREYMRELGEASELYARQQTALGAMAAATGNERVVEDMDKERRRLRKKWRI